MTALLLKITPSYSFPSPYSLTCLPHSGFLMLFVGVWRPLL